MRRLYVQIYLAFLLVGLGSLTVTGVVAVSLFDAPGPEALRAAIAASEVAQGPRTGMQTHLEKMADTFDAHLSVWNADGVLLARAGRALPRGKPGWFRRAGIAGVRVNLAHGRTLAAAHATPGSRGCGGLGVLGLLAGVVAVGCYPIARRITHRLEGVQEGVVRWGQGDLSARVPVVGTDEVAAVAATFNDAAARVEQLFEAQRRVLASASHELRSPLTRLRLGVELARDGLTTDEAWAEAAIADIEELDATVGDLLQVGRMQALSAPQDPEAVDLLALLHEEADRIEAEVTVAGPAVTVVADLRLMRRMARNLLENAAKHGAPPIEARTHPRGFEVTDGGPGIPDEVAQRIFEPFYRPDGHAEGRDGGVGLGLFLVREIARHHGGDVHCETPAGGGTRFRFTLSETSTAVDAP